MYSYWHNIFSNNEQFLPNKIKTLTNYFYLISLEKIQEQLTNAKSQSVNAIISKVDFFLKSSDNILSFYHGAIQTIDSFYQFDSLKGFVMDIQLKVNEENQQIEFNYETFFLLEPLNDNFHFNYIPDGQNGNINSFLKDLEEIAICSEFVTSYYKKLNKCSSLIQQMDDPELIIKVKPQTIYSQFEVVWKSPKGLEFKKTQVEYNSEYGMMTSTFFKRDEQRKFIDSTGIWTVELKYEQELVLFKNFLVMPNKEVFNMESKSEWIRIFEQFWKYETMCIKSVRSTSGSINLPETLKNCSNEIFYWSTVYPDPKSDLNETIGLDHKHRVGF